MTNFVVKPLEKDRKKLKKNLCLHSNKYVQQQIRYVFTTGTKISTFKEIFLFVRLYSSSETAMQCFEVKRSIGG